uniref:Uncharacterized protein n=1 Tax=Plectus sambesii TaxID=2011161 RepID=A0A914VZV2_9BILA
MGDKRFLWVLLALVIVLLGSGAAVGQASGPPPKTKLCGNDDCTEVLFEGTVNRPQQGTHSEFLHYPDVGATIKVYAIKFSDRTDLWEGGIDDEASEKSRGFFYSQHVNIDGYLNFLRNAVKQNKTLFVHNQLAQMKYKSLLGTKQAMPELIKDLEVTERRYAAENNLPEPEPLDLAALGFQVENGHGHSHGGHGHSHGGHGHSHGGHGHSHDAHDAHGHSHGGHDHSHDDHNHGHSHEAPASDAKPKVEQNALRRNMQQQAGSNPQPKPDPVPQPTPVVADPKPTLTPSQVPTPTEAPQTVKAVKPPSTTGEPKPAVTNDVPEVKPAVVKDVPE